jgi:hypothetical protein
MSGTICIYVSGVSASVVRLGKTLSKSDERNRSIIKSWNPKAPGCGIKNKQHPTMRVKERDTTAHTSRSQASWGRESMLRAAQKEEHPSAAVCWGRPPIFHELGSTEGFQRHQRNTSIVVNEQACKRQTWSTETAVVKVLDGSPHFPEHNLVFLFGEGRTWRTSRDNPIFDVDRDETR